MAQVTIRINGFAYTIGCKDGEEQHLLSMAREVEHRIDSIKASAGQSGEARMLAMASLLMADEVFELRQRVDELIAQAGGPDPKLSRKLNRMAKRAEQIAANLDHP